MTADWRTAMKRLEKRSDLIETNNFLQYQGIKLCIIKYKSQSTEDFKYMKYCLLWRKLATDCS